MRSGNALRRMRTMNTRASLQRISVHGRDSSGLLMRTMWMCLWHLALCVSPWSLASGFVMRSSITVAASSTTSLSSSFRSLSYGQRCLGPSPSLSCDPSPYLALSTAGDKPSPSAAVVSSTDRSFSEIARSHLNEAQYHNRSRAASTSSEDNDISRRHQLIVVLVGIPGSGKSTFARRVAHLISNPSSKWTVLCQDDIGSRLKVLRRAEKALEDPSICLIIDRCNFNVQQRQHWISLARRHRNESGRSVDIVAVVMPHWNDPDLCGKRAQARGVDRSHPDPTDWPAVCRTITNQCEEPTESEGFAAIYRISNENPDNKDVEHILCLLDSLRIASSLSCSCLTMTASISES